MHHLPHLLSCSETKTKLSGFSHGNFYVEQHINTLRMSPPPLPTDIQSMRLALRRATFCFCSRPT